MVRQLPLFKLKIKNMNLKKENREKYTLQTNELIEQQRFKEAFEIASKYHLNGFMVCKTTAKKTYRLKDSELEIFNSKEIINRNYKGGAPTTLFLEAELKWYKKLN